MGDHEKLSCMGHAVLTDQTKVQAGSWQDAISNKHVAWACLAELKQAFEGKLDHELTSERISMAHL